MGIIRCACAAGAGGSLCGVCGVSRWQAVFCRGASHLPQKRINFCRLLRATPRGRFPPYCCVVPVGVRIILYGLVRSTPKREVFLREASYLPQTRIIFCRLLWVTPRGRFPPYCCVVPVRVRILLYILMRACYTWSVSPGGESGRIYWCSRIDGFHITPSKGGVYALGFRYGRRMVVARWSV